VTPAEIIVVVLALLGIVLGAYGAVRGDRQSAGLGVVLIGIAFIVTRGL
jgi:hypothetical protein